MGYPPDHSSHAASAPQPTLVSVVRERLRLKHYSLRTEQSDVGWIRRYIRFHGDAIRARWVRPRLRSSSRPWRWIARVSAATQNQALAALLFLYREVLGVELRWLDGITRAKDPERVPVVMIYTLVLNRGGRGVSAQPVGDAGKKGMADHAGGSL